MFTQVGAYIHVEYSPLDHAGVLPRAWLHVPGTDARRMRLGGEYAKVQMVGLKEHGLEYNRV